MLSQIQLSDGRASKPLRKPKLATVSRPNPLCSLTRRKGYTNSLCGMLLRSSAAALHVSIHRLGAQQINPLHRVYYCSRVGTAAAIAAASQSSNTRGAKANSAQHWQCRGYAARSDEQEQKVGSGALIDTVVRSLQKTLRPMQVVKGGAAGKNTDVPGSDIDLIVISPDFDHTRIRSRLLAG